MKTNHILPSVGLLLSVLQISSAQTPDWVAPTTSVTGAVVERNRTRMERAEWLYRQRALPTGEIPVGARERALDEIKKAKQMRGFSAASAPTERWVSIGPAPIQGLPISPPAPMSGRVADIAVDPLDTNHWLIATAQGGIWETRNAGGNWRPLTDDQASLAMGAITYAPGDPSVIYAGTGEAVFSGSAYAGAGLLKSEDGGQSWHLLGTNAFAGTSFSGIRVHPSEANRLVAATAFGSLWVERGLYIPFAPPSGLHTSDDGGTNWTLRLPGHASDLEVHPRDFARQYAALGSIFGTMTNGLLQSTNGVYRSADAGQTWGRVPGPWDSLSNRLGRIEMAVAPTDANVLYVSVSTAMVVQGVNYSGGILHGIWRTTNAWAASPTWTQLPNPSAEPGVWYYQQLSVHPTNASILYFGELAMWRYNGSFWTVLAGNYDGNSVIQKIHPDQHAIAWAGSRLIVGNDGGVWSSTNDGATWTNHNTDLTITQFYHGALHPTNPNIASGGSQDNGAVEWTGSNSWQYIGLLGDGCESAISSRNPDRHWGLSYQNSSIWRTLDGSTFSDVSGGIEKVNTPFVTRFAKHPVLDDLFIHGTDKLWKCTNFFSGFPAWSSNSPALLYPVRATFPVNMRTNILPDLISAMTFAASDATGNTYAYGTTWGTLRLTTNGGRNWINLDPTNALPDRFVTDVAFDPNDANVLWLTMSSYYEAAPLQPGHVFKTTNALAATPTWLNVSPPVNIPHNTIVIDPIDPNHVFVGTDIGVWQTTDGGANWTHMGPETGMPNVAVFELELNEPTDRLVAFTHGRGAFALVNTNAASLRLTQTASQNPVAPGCELTYTLNVRNLGPRTATGIALTNTLPAGVSFVSATSSQGSCAQASGVVTCQLGVLPALSNVVISVVVTPMADGARLTNTASVTANEPENTPRNNSTMVANAVAVSVTVSPGAQAVAAGSSITFRAVANSCNNATFQWHFNGAALPGATNETLVIGDVQLAHEGSYSVRVANVFGSSVSDAAQLIVLVNPVITIAPVSQSVVAGGSATFSVGFTGNPMPFGVEWRQGFITMASNTVSGLSSFFTLANAHPTNAATWRVIVRNLARNTVVGENRTFTLTVLPDSDGDGLPDAWETTYPTAASGAEDTDRDGLTNLQEYQAGTDPTNALSYLRVDTIALAGASNLVSLRFLATSNKTYTIQHRNTVDGVAWNRLADVLAASTNRLIEIIDTNGPSANTQRYYRLATPRSP